MLSKMLSKMRSSDFSCGICLKSFENNYHLQRHLNGKKQCKPPDKDGRVDPFQCKFCEHTFANQSNLDRHLNVSKKTACYILGTLKVSSVSNTVINNIEKIEQMVNENMTPILTPTPILKPTPIPQMITVNNTNTKCHGFEYVYMIRLREFVRLNENTYKIGKTTRAPNERMGNYPKDSEVIVFIQVEDCHEMELRIMREFSKKFIRRADYGDEFFEGEVEEMKKVFLHITNSHGGAVHVQVENHHETELKIMRDFCKNFVQVIDWGEEYREGDIQQMRSILLQIMDDYKKQMCIKVK